MEYPRLPRSTAMNSPILLNCFCREENCAYRLSGLCGCKLKANVCVYLREKPVWSIPGWLRAICPTYKDGCEDAEVRFPIQTLMESNKRA